ncbi:MAG: M20 metallopeptidase family protein [Sediminispirochaetaceae bacterium]
MSIKDRIAELKDELIELRRDFHMHPELGFQEHRTAEKVEGYLKDIGLVPRRVAETGVVAVLEGTNPGPMLLLRADMDALPIEEENDVPYVSRNPGCMHACGHDAHTAMLLVAARVLVEHRSEIPGKILFLFQPNEEVAGAEIMVEQGAIDDPRPDAAMALHIWTPLPSGTIGVQAGAVMATMDVFRITVKGRGGHTGYPESARDPIIAAADIVQSVQTIQTRRISLMKPTVIMFGKIAGGTKNNIIPDEVVLEGTMRYLYEGDPDSEDNPPVLLRQIAEGVCATHGCACDISIERENTAVVNDPDMVRLARETAVKILGDQQKVVEHASMAGEDFSAFTSRMPGVFTFLGTADAEKQTDYPHHNPRFNIDEDVLPTGVEFLVEGALTYFSKSRKRR